MTTANKNVKTGVTTTGPTSAIAAVVANNSTTPLRPTLVATAKVHSDFDAPTDVYTPNDNTANEDADYMRVLNLPFGPYSSSTTEGTVKSFGEVVANAGDVPEAHDVAEWQAARAKVAQHTEHIAQGRRGGNQKLVAMGTAYRSSAQAVMDNIQQKYPSWPLDCSELYTTNL